MLRWPLVLLLAGGILCAGLGTALTLQATPLGAASFGWTAYSPLSDAAYSPGDPTTLSWTSKLAATLLAIGAGTTGATSTALVLTRRNRTGPRR